MSRLKLKKALSELTEEQLRELLLQLYNVRKEAKEYLEFFMNPDIEKKCEETAKALEKELGRYKSRYRHSFPAYRMTKIKALMKHFAGFGPEDEMYADLWFKLICDISAIWIHYDINDGQLKSLVKFFTDFLTFIDKAGLFSANIVKVKTLLEAFPETYYGRTISDNLYLALTRFAEEKKSI